MTYGTIISFHLNSNHPWFVKDGTDHLDINALHLKLAENGKAFYLSAPAMIRDERHSFYLTLANLRSKQQSIKLCVTPKLSFGAIRYHISKKIASCNS